MHCRLLTASIMRSLAVLMMVLVATGACSSSGPKITIDVVTAPSSSSPGSRIAVTTPSNANSSPTTSVGAASGPVESGVATTTTLPPLTPANAPLVTWNGKAQYIHGANLPWFNFGRDFGGGPDGGASSPATNTAVNVALRAASDAGMNVVRWWLFPGAASQFTVDAAGLPTGFTKSVYQDIDAALELARANRIAYTFTLFSGPTAFPSTWRNTEEGQKRLAQVLAELFRRYKDNPQIMTWDVINEPEFDIWSGGVTVETVRAFIARIVDAAHANTSTPVTVGGARMDGLRLLTGLGLDYYTVHWYDPMTDRQQCLACVSYADLRDGFKIDKPIVVGEYYSPKGLGDRFELWRLHGFAGSMPWSLLPDRTVDRYSIDLVAAAAFAKAHGLG